MINYRSIFILLLIVSLSGCSLFRARPLKSAGFLPWPEVVAENRKRAPFNGYWVFDAVEYDLIKNDFQKVYVAPVDTAIVKSMYLETEGDDDIRTERIQEAEQLANYFKSKIELLLREGGVNVAEAPGPKTLSLKLALVQVIPTSPGINIVGTVAGYFVPGGGLLKIAGEGSVAMEGFVTEENQFPILYEQFKDREGQKYRPFSVKDYQRYAHIREILDEWSVQIYGLITTPYNTEVEESTLVSINPL